MKDLYKYLPVNMVEQMMYATNEKILKSVPILNLPMSDNLIQTISTRLIPEIYLPCDHIIYVNDIGKEMFFIIEGSVDILTPDSKKVANKLGPGNYVGEMVLMCDMKHTCSVVANTFCLMYLLKNEDFETILEDYSNIKDVIRMENTRR